MAIRQTAKPNKQQLMVTTLRERIVVGHLPPGSRLSSRELRREFAACAATTQAAVKQLTGDGFLYTEPGRGTFVSQAPPHLTTIGVVFPVNPLTCPPDGTFNSMLAYQCLACQQSGQQKLNLYFSVTGHVDDEDYQRALADVAARRVGGLFIIYGNNILATPLFTQPGIARVTISEPAPGIPGIHTPQEQFFTRGLSYLSARGRRRAVILGCGMPNARAFCAELAAAHNLTLQPHWFLPSLPGGAGEQLTVIRHYVYLLMRDERDRPDCLLISDDIATDSVVAGILDAGLRIGEDVDVVAHCNYPLLKPDQWPVKRLGWPAPAVLDTAFSLLEQQRRGETPAATVTVPFLFDDEYEARMHASNTSLCLDIGFMITN